jgi:glycosyltransferase involved in cell wall biosynthesis
MNISIITVCYNSVKTIRKTIESVLNQINVEFEYIIIDGKSEDGTIEIIEEYADKNSGKIFWSSEPDRGIYDAMNKGINMAAGDIISILNSDDIYASADVIYMVNKTMVEKDLDSCYGNLVYIKNNKPYRYWRAGIQESFKFGWMPPHPTFFVKKCIYEKYGLYRLDCGVNADYELMLRLLEIHTISTTWINKVLVYMTVGGVSNSGLKSRLDAFLNDNTAWKKNNLSPCFFTLLLKWARKLTQFIAIVFFRPVVNLSIR